MLRLVLGRAGSGKTKYARECFARADGGAFEKQILIVPEQYSFESERAILELLGPGRAKDVSVMSFSRLTEWFFRVHGGLAGERLSDGGRAILMELAAQSVMDQLEVYAGAAKRGELGAVLLSTLSEFKSCALGAQELSALAQSLPEAELSKKLSEVALIFGAYEALVAGGYADPLDDLTKMANMLPQTDFFSGARIVLDSFTGFTAQELLLIRRMLEQAREVTVTLCTDSLRENEAGYGRFSNVKKTAAKLERLAREEGITVLEPVHLDPPAAPRFESEELLALSENLFAPEVQPYPEEPQAVRVFRAADLYEEAEFVASEIRRLVMEEGYRYREIAILSRAPEGYLGILDTALEKREIPYFMDRPQEVARKALCRLITAALSILENGYDQSGVLTYLKTGLAGLSDDEIFLLENYIFIWNISGKRWLFPFTENPGGFSAPQDETAAQTLAKINLLRERVTGPLEALRAALTDANGRKAAEAIYRFLEEVSAQEALDSLCGALEAQGEREEAALQVRLWDLVMADLDQIAAAAADAPLSLSMLRRIFDTLFSVNRLSEIPQRADQVSVSAAQRSRPEKIRAAFLIGAVRGSFPLTPSMEGLFSDRERRTLIEAGMPIGRTFEDSAAEELLLAYEAACCASERLYVSYAKTGSAFESELVLGVKAVFPKLTETQRRDEETEFFASSPAAAFSLAAQHARENTVLAQTLHAALGDSPLYGARLQAVTRAAEKKPLSIEDKSIAASLFGSGHHLSATQLETYHLCRFRYFCQYGLRAKKLEEARIDPLQYGSLMHYLLEKLFLEHESAEVLAMSEPELRTRIAALCEEYAALNFGAQEEKGKRFQSAITRLGDSAYYLIVHIAEELSQSRFSPKSFELAVGSGEYPLSIPMPDGREIRISGKIDRVDTYENEGVTYVRVIDYKTGAKEFRYSDLLCGLNLQMLIYLGALIEDRRTKAAGVLYMPAIRPLVLLERGADSAEAKQKIEKAFQMKGVVLNDPQVLHAMEEALAAQYIPYGTANGREKGADYLLSEADFDLLHRLVEKQIVNMQLTLDAGDIDAKPLMQNKFGCDYCPYFAICGRLYDPGEVTDLKGTKEEIFEKIGEAVK